MSSNRPVPVKVTYSATSTGASDTFFYGEGMSAISVTHKLTGGTTKAISFVVQASIGYSGVWQNITAATTASTSGGVANSTVAMTFDKARVSITANATTGNGTLTLHALAR